MTPQREPAPPPGPLAVGRSRDELLAEVVRALAVVPVDVAVVVAASGGPDSAALAFLTAEARPDLAITLGHVRHGLRDDADDLTAVREHASFLGTPLAIDQVTVVDAGEGIEAAARAQRYASLRRIAREIGSGWILLGHTAEDQAETVLMRLVRGTGLTGLSGMSPDRGGLVRPLLRLRRPDVRAFVDREGIRWIDDPMNADPAFTRVVARSTVLPVLRELGHDPVAALARLADLARDDAETLQGHAQAATRSLTRSYGPCLVVATDDLLALPRAIGSRVVRSLVVDVQGGGDPPTSAQVAQILSLRAGAAVEVPGAAVTCGGGWTAFAPRDLIEVLTMPLGIPGITRWTATGDEIVAADASSDPGASDQLTLSLPDVWIPPHVNVLAEALPPGGDVALGQVVLGWMHDSIVVRPRRHGDRVVTAVGTRKLQDVLVDAGVPRAVRELVPVVATGERVLWIPGIVVDAEAADTGRDRPTLHLHIRRPRRRR